MKKWYVLGYFVIVLMAINSIQVLSINQLSKASNYISTSESNTNQDNLIDNFNFDSKDVDPTVYTDFTNFVQYWDEAVASTNYGDRIEFSYNPSMGGSNTHEKDSYMLTFDDWTGDYEVNVTTSWSIQSITPTWHFNVMFYDYDSIGDTFDRKSGLSIQDGWTGSSGRFNILGVDEIFYGTYDEVGLSRSDVIFSVTRIDNTIYYKISQGGTILRSMSQVEYHGAVNCVYIYWDHSLFYTDGTSAFNCTDISVILGDKDSLPTISTPPEINLIVPVNNTAHHSETLIEIDIVDPDLDQVLYNWDGSANNTWSAPYYTYLPLSAGQHMLNIYANSTDSNSTFCYFVFTTNDNLPFIELLSPEQYSVNLEGTMIVLNITDDVSISTILYNWDGNSNESSAIINPVSIEIPDVQGEHILYVYVNDTDNNWETASFTFYTQIIYDWLILIYLDGDNNLETNAIDDFNELEHGYDGAQNIAILVLIDRAPGYDTSDGDWTGTRLYEIQPDGSSSLRSLLLENNGELNMGSGSTLEYFINYGFTNYLADRYWLNLWNHGGGVDGLCWDDTSNGDYLTLNEMQDAVYTVENAHGKKFDLISHDCCFMNMIEVAYEIRNLADYFVSSEESIPLDGFDYTPIIFQLCLTPTMSGSALATLIVDTYDSFYSSTEYTALSAIDLSQINVFTVQANSFATELENAVNTGYGGNIEDAFFNSLAFFYYYSLDFKDFVNEIKKDTSLMNNNPLLQTATYNLFSAFSLIIKDNYQHTCYDGRASGISIFMPYSNPTYDSYIANYIARSSMFTGMDWQANTNWDEFLDEFYSRGFGYGIPGMEELAFGVSTGSQSIGSGEDDLYYFEVTQECVYEVVAQVSSGDADIYLIDQSSMTMVAYSEYYNPSDGSTERMRVDLDVGIYIVDVYGWSLSSYSLTAYKKYPTVLNIGGSASGSGGTQYGDDYGHYSQIANHYYQVSINQVGSYRFELTYDSDVVDFDLYLMSSSYVVQFISDNVGDVDALNINFSYTTIVILCIFGYSGHGSFTIRVTPRDSTSANPTNTNGLNGFTLPLTILALLGISSYIFFRKRKK
ncbi:MAG: hypothetical protein FK730_14795 [Asgard group archaeon]|nr:hypothetical protein [Asgard group archaeon]